MKKTDIIFKQGDTTSYNSLRYGRKKAFIFNYFGCDMDTVNNMNIKSCRLVLLEKFTKKLFWERKQ